MGRSQDVAPRGLANPEGTDKEIIRFNAALLLDEIGVTVDPDHLGEAVEIAYSIRSANRKLGVWSVLSSMDAVLIVLRDKGWPHRVACERIGVDRRRAMDTYNFAARRREVQALRRAQDAHADRG